MGGGGKGLSWFHHMGLKISLDLMCELLEHTPLHEQKPLRNIIMLMEVGRIWSQL
jgi:hypothetical protein